MVPYEADDERCNARKKYREKIDFDHVYIVAQSLYTSSALCAHKEQPCYTFNMKTPFAGGKMSGSPLEKSDEKSELLYEYPNNEEMFEKDFDKELRSDPYLEVHASDIREWRAFRRAFNLHNTNLNQKEIIILGEDRNVAITRAFNLDNSAHLTFATESKAAAHMLETKGNIHAIKADPEWHHFEKRGFIVVARNDDLRVTKHLIKNVEPGGWFLCGVDVANALRGKFKVMGVIEQGGAYPSINKSVGDDFWEDMGIESDDELRSAPKTDGIVTFDEAKKMVEAAGMSTSNVLKSYKRLVELAKRDGSLKPDGNYTLTLKIKDKEVVIDNINPVLPTKENKHENDTVVMKRIKGI